MHRGGIAYESIKHFKAKVKVWQLKLSVLTFTFFQFNLNLGVRFIRYGKRIIAVFIALLMCSTSVFAEDTTTATFKATIENENISIVETDLKDTIDNSSLPVKVVKQVGEQSITIYEGLLGGYDNGVWNNTDFSDIAFLVLFDWDSAENEAIYIIPTETNVVTSDIQTTSETDSDDTALLTDVEVIQYDLKYSITDDGTNTVMNITCTMNNSGTEAKTLVLLVALYDDGKLVNFKSNDIPVNGNSSSGEKNFSFTLPTPNKDSYSVKLMAWESLSSIRPLGPVKPIKDLETFAREKYIFVTVAENAAFNIFMNSSYSKGDNDIMTHTISYEAQKIIPTDLCGFTYTKELCPINIVGAGVNITEYDSENGKIVYQFTKPTGRNTGINNVVKFKALTGLAEAQITYTIQ